MSHGRLTQRQIAALRSDPLTRFDDPEQWYAHIGWLVCALDVLDALDNLADPEQAGGDTRSPP